jgi:hypothetical protein
MWIFFKKYPRFYINYLWSLLKYFLLLIIDLINDSNEKKGHKRFQESAGRYP